MNGARIVPATPANIAEAAARLRAGKLVAFPTETVYGLGANAWDAEAVASIFRAKGRPSTNPVIVHVAEVAQARELAKRWPAVAEELAERFWPGPLTLVVEKAEDIPAIVTAGGNTVGVRVPDHPVARELLRVAGVPVAAPSANRSEEVSPTLAVHVAESLGPYVEDLLILDGGACDVGIESTVLDVTGKTPRVLRPGMAQIPDVWLSASEPADTPIARSPGQMLRHYAPGKPVALFTDTPSSLLESDALLYYSESVTFPLPPFARQMPPTPQGYAVHLYAALRELDAESRVRRILIELPPDSADWAAVRDRLRRAATPAGGKDKPE